MKSLKTRIAQDICKLNNWETPKSIQKVFGRELTEDEIRTAMSILTVYVPYEVWIKEWRKELKNESPQKAEREDGRIEREDLSKRFY